MGTCVSLLDAQNDLAELLACFKVAVGLRRLVQGKVRSTILIGEMAERIARDWSGSLKTELASSLADAVERAHANAKPGEVVLFSPGTSSFDMFKSYADRGDQFRALVQALPK